MFDFFRKPKFSARLFVISSLSAFFILIICYLFYNLFTKYDQAVTYGSADRYYLNTDYIEGDTFLTKVPNLKDMLAGPIISDFDPSMGYSDTPVAIVEFSDFTCDFCQKQEQIIKKILQNYKNEVRLIWKDYPDRNVNTLSYKAAVAARCAGEQDKFWPYHDFLYEKGKKLSDNTFLEIAGLLSLDKKRFNECIGSGQVKKMIDDNIEEADALQITGVPFFYINDQEVMGEITYEQLDRIVNIELSKTKK